MNTVTAETRRRASRTNGKRQELREDPGKLEVSPEGGCLLARSGMLMTQALAAAHSAPDIREDKVAAIKARLAAGTYEIDSMALAEALVDQNPGLFGRL